MELYAPPDTANEDAGPRLLRWAERRAGELAAETPSDRSRPPSEVRAAVLQRAVGVTDDDARGLLESAGYTLARVFFYIKLDLGEEAPNTALPEGLKLHAFPPAGGPDPASPWPSWRPSGTTGALAGGVRSMGAKEEGGRRGPRYLYLAGGDRARRDRRRGLLRAPA